MARNVSRRGLLHAALVSAGLGPFALLGWEAVAGTLGANPVEEISHRTGIWTLRLLLLTLAVTPVRRWLRRPGLVRIRRTLGLLSFFYACLHFTTYVVLDLSLDVSALGEDLRERPYITAGFSAFVLLLPLALTSSRAAIRRLGRRWGQLHRLVYVAAIAAVVHFLWLGKADTREPLIYAGILAGLLALRLVRVGWWSSILRGLWSDAQLAPARPGPPGGQQGAGEIVPDAEDGAGQRGQR